MPDDMKTTIYNQAHQVQGKHTYFLLAAAGACIALAVNQTHALALTCSQIPLGLAVLFWAGSFCCGCMNRAYVDVTLYANYALLQVQEGTHPLSGRHPQKIQAASEGIRDALDYNIRWGSRYGRWQFNLLIMGAVSYLTWHILEMYLRTS